MNLITPLSDGRTAHKGISSPGDPWRSLFITQVMEKPMRRGALLDLIQTNKEGFVRDLKPGSSLGCTAHEMMESRIARAGRG